MEDPSNTLKSDPRNDKFDLKALVEQDKPILNALAKPLEILTKPAKGGGVDRYVPHGAVTRLLNEVYGLHWETFPIREIVTENDIAVCIGIRYYTGNGEIKTRHQWGGAKIYGSDELGQKAMAATSKAIKKVASLLGVAGSLEDMEDYPVTNEQLEKIVELLEKAGKSEAQIHKKLAKLVDITYLQADQIIQELLGQG